MAATTNERTIIAGMRDRVLTLMQHWTISASAVAAASGLSRSCVSNALSANTSRRKRTTFATMNEILSATTKIVEDRRSKIAKNGLHG